MKKTTPKIAILILFLVIGVVGGIVFLFRERTEHEYMERIIFTAPDNENEKEDFKKEEFRKEDFKEEGSENIVSVKIRIKGEGDVYPKEGDYSYEKAEKIILRATPKEGWFFQGWSQPQESIPGIPQMSKSVHYSLFDEEGPPFDHTRREQNEAELRVDRDYEIWVNFEKEEHELVVNVLGEGDVYPRSGSFHNHAATVNIKPMPAEGWVFKNWEKCGVYLPAGFLCDNIYDKEVSVLMGLWPPEFKLTAIFEKEESIKENIIEVRVEDLGENNIEGLELIDPGVGLYQYSPGKVFTAEATSSNDYEFLSWRLCSYSLSGEYGCEFFGKEKEISFSKKGGRVLLIAQFLRKHEFRVVE